MNSTVGTTDSPLHVGDANPDGVGTNGTAETPFTVEQFPYPTTSTPSDPRVGVVGTPETAFIIAGSAPVNLEAPEIVGGPQPGFTLTCLIGEWTDYRSIAFQWRNGAEPLPGETRNDLDLTEAHVGMTIACVVTAGNEFGTTDAVSNAVLVVP
jgi:hypothetical protein